MLRVIVCAADKLLALIANCPNCGQDRHSNLEPKLRRQTSSEADAGRDARIAAAASLLIPSNSPSRARRGQVQVHHAGRDFVCMSCSPYGDFTSPAAQL